MLSYDISTLFQQKIDLFDKLIELLISETKQRIIDWNTGMAQGVKDLGCTMA